MGRKSLSPETRAAREAFGKRARTLRLAACLEIAVVERALEMRRNSLCGIERGYAGCSQEFQNALIVWLTGKTRGGIADDGSGDNLRDLYVGMGAQRRAIMRWLAASLAARPELDATAFLVKEGAMVPEVAEVPA
jgi:hypothetical protein